MKIRFVPHPDPSLPFAAATQVGDIVYLSGQIGVDAKGNLSPDIATQSRVAMENLAHSAALAGVGLEDVFKCTVMLTDMADWQAFNIVYREFFAADKLPARSSFAAAGLAFGALVEIEALAIMQEAALPD